MVFSTAASATHLGQTKTVNGVAIYLGLVPAAVMRQNPDIYPAHEPRPQPQGIYEDRFGSGVAANAGDCGQSCGRLNGGLVQSLGS